MGKSLTWPRPSYDGKYLLFTLMDYGYFSIWHEESDQWLLDLQTGEFSLQSFVCNKESVRTSWVAGL